MAKYLQTINTTEDEVKKARLEPFEEKNKNIIIEFDKIFINENFNVYNKFVTGIGKKRVYSSMATDMCNDNNMILNQCDPQLKMRILYSYFTIKKAIDLKKFVKIDDENTLQQYGAEAHRDFGKYENFINFLISTLFTVDFIEAIKAYVEEHYEVSVDEKESANYAEATTFTNEHLKLIYTASYMTKFAIPLCTHYIFINSDLNIDVFNFMYTIFDAIFKIIVVGTNCSNLMNKLYQYCDRIVSRTESSNKRIWDSFPMFNKTRESIVDELVIKIVTTIIPKADLKKSVIKLIAVVARMSIMEFNIRANNPYDCYRINDSDNSSDDEDKLSENDIFDMFYRNTDESIVILNRYANDDAIDCICRRNNVYISQEEFEFYKKNYQLHYFTVNIVSTVFARFFSGVDNVRSCTFDQFVKLMIVLIHKMKDLGIEYLPHFVTATRASYSFTRAPSVSVLKQLKNDHDYNQLIEIKYRNIRSVFEIKTSTSDERNPIKDMIVSLIHNDYIYNEFGGKHNGEKIPVDESAIVKDVIKVYKQMLI